MLYWALVAAVLALVFGFIGFGDGVTTVAAFAQVISFVFLFVFVVALVMGLMDRRPTPH